MKPTVIYLLGTDGAGKTTLATRLARELEEQGWDYLYCQAMPRLVWPFRWLAGKLFLQRADQFKDYDTYRERKRAASGRRRWLTRIYAWIWYVDFLLQAWPKLLRARWRGRHLLIDRYYLDVVVNMGVLQDNDTAGMLADARALERWVPRATRHLFLDVSEETAFARKNDIQSVRYLRERKQRYLQLAEAYRFVSVDANQPADIVLVDVRRILSDAL